MYGASSSIVVSMNNEIKLFLERMRFWRGTTVKSKSSRNSCETWPASLVKRRCLQRGPPVRIPRDGAEGRQEIAAHGPYFVEWYSNSGRGGSLPRVRSRTPRGGNVPAAPLSPQASADPTRS